MVSTWLLRFVLSKMKDLRNTRDFSVHGSGLALISKRGTLRSFTGREGNRSLPGSEIGEILEFQESKGESN